MTLTTFLVAETYFECLVRQEFNPDTRITLGGNRFYVGEVHMILFPHLPERVARTISARACACAEEIRAKPGYSEDDELDEDAIRTAFKSVWSEIKGKFDPLEDV